MGVALAQYATVDMAVWVKPTESLRASMRIENLSAERYFIRANQYSYGRTLFVSLDGVWE